MKTILKKLFPGAAFVAAVCLVIGLARAQSSQTVSVPGAPSVPASQPTASQTITLCGNCGHELAAPQVVYVAQAVRPAPRFAQGGGNGYGQPFYGMPPVAQAAPVYYVDDSGACYYRPPAPRQSIYGLSTQWAIPEHRIPPNSSQGHGRHHIHGPACRY